ncbi:MAG: hypothetical protein ACJ72D_04725 [Marmoricola sp.]
MSTRVATANILYKLPAAAAREALEQVLAPHPDLVGVQEWYVSRLGLLRRTGDVRLAPLPGTVPAAGKPRYHWVATLGAGNLAGARADRFDVVGARSVTLSGVGRSDRPDRFAGTEPPRLAAVGVFRDRQVDRTVALVSYHLCPGVERGAAYIDDRPRLVARHRHEVARVEALVAELTAAGHVVYAVGDSNFDAQRFAGVTSAWVGREDAPGTIGSRTRKLDDVHGPGPATEVQLLATPSDHRAVVALRPD